MSGTKTIGAVTVVLAAVGGAVLLGTGIAAASTGVGKLTPRSGALTADADGVSLLDLRVGAAEVRVEFDEVEHAQLRVEGGDAQDWSLRNVDGELEVRGPDHGFDWFGGGWWDFDWDDRQATLVLPLELEGIDADLTLEAGSLRVDGRFGELDLDVQAGYTSVDGTVNDLDVNVEAGRADIDLDGVQAAQFTVSAGRLEATLQSTPDSVEANVSAGALVLVVPDDEYDLSQTQSAGSIDSTLTVDTDSTHKIDVEVSAGSAKLRPAGTGD